MSARTPASARDDVRRAATARRSPTSHMIAAPADRAVVADRDPVTGLPGPRTVQSRLAGLGRARRTTAALIIQLGPATPTGWPHSASTRHAGPTPDARLLRLVARLVDETLNSYLPDDAFAGALPPDSLLLLVPARDVFLVKESLRDRFARATDVGARADARLELAAIPLHDVRGRSHEATAMRPESTFGQDGRTSA